MDADAVVPAGNRAGKPLREIAINRYGREQVDADWLANSRMCAKLRRVLQRAEAGSGGGAVAK